MFRKIYKVFPHHATISKGLLLEMQKLIVEHLLSLCLEIWKTVFKHIFRKERWANICNYYMPVPKLPECSSAHPHVTAQKSIPASILIWPEKLI